MVRYELNIFFVFLHQMLSHDTRSKIKISLQEMSLKGAQILAQRSEITFAQAFQQAQRLKKTSKVNSLSKKNREGA